MGQAGVLGSGTDNALLWRCCPAQERNSRGFTTTYGAPLEDGVVLRPYGVLKYGAGYRVPDSRRLLWSGARGSAKFIRPFHEILLFSSEADKIVMGE